MTNFDYMRNRLMTAKGMISTEPTCSIEEIMLDIKTKHAEMDEVIKLAKSRAAMGTFRYGTGANHDKYNYANRIQQKLDRYNATRNTEFLVDVLNYAALEFNHPSITGAFFKATDDDTASTRGFDNE